MTSPLPHRPAFTLLELLVLVAILTLIAALAVTGIQKARVMALRSDCQHRLRNQSTAVFTHEARTGRLPPGSISGPYSPLNVPEDVNHSLWTVLLAELDQPAAAAAYRWDVNYDDPLNQHVVSTQIGVLLCPAYDPSRVENWSDGRTAGVADYAPIMVNPFLADIAAIDPASSFEGPLPTNGMARMTEIKDGLANTILLAEAGGRPGMAWSSSAIPIPVKSVLGGGVHMGGCNVALCDGSVRFLRSSIDIRILARLATRSGGEALGNDW